MSSSPANCLRRQQRIGPVQLLARRVHLAASTARRRCRVRRHLMPHEWSRRYAKRTLRMTSSAIRELLKVTEQPDVISFAGGLPAPEAFPIEEVAEAARRILRDAGPRALQYGATEGYRPLREWV